jgi:transposase
MAIRLKVAWAESAEELEPLYKAEKQVEQRTRLLALWHLRQGKRIEDVVEMLGVAYRTLQNWVNWYRCGGLAEVLRRVRGHGSNGEHGAYLTALQQRALFAKVKLGEFRTIWDAVVWVEGRRGVCYTYKGLYDLLERHDCKPKVPRPVSVKANPVLQEQWKKGA